jgi:hypothetical protein
MVLSYDPRHQIAFIQPMQVVLEDIKRTLGATEVCLPRSKNKRAMDAAMEYTDRTRRNAARRGRFTMYNDSDSSHGELKKPLTRRKTARRTRRATMYNDSDSSFSNGNPSSNTDKEIRLRFDNTHPINLELSGDMYGRTLQLVPGGNGTTEVVIGSNMTNSHRQTLSNNASPQAHIEVNRTGSNRRQSYQAYENAQVQLARARQTEIAEQQYKDDRKRENGMTDLVIGSSSRNEGRAYHNQKGGAQGNDRRSMIEGSRRRDIDDHSERSSRTGRTRREREREGILEGREEPRPIMRRTIRLPVIVDQRQGEVDGRRHEVVYEDPEIQKGTGIASRRTPTRSMIEGQKQREVGRGRRERDDSSGGREEPGHALRRTRRTVYD